MKRKRTDLVPYGSYVKKRKVMKKYIPKIPRRLVGYVRTSGYQKYVGKSEIKFFDTAIATTAITTGGVIINNSLNLMVEGSDNNQRIGKKVVVTKIHLRGTLQQPPVITTTTNTTSYRIILYLDKQCNASAATVAQILTSADDNAFLNLENSERFLVLKDWFLVVNNPITAIAGPAYTTGTWKSPPLVFNKKCSIPLKYNSTNGGTVADLTSNNIGIMAVSSLSTGGLLDMQARIRFSDG